MRNILTAIAMIVLISCGSPSSDGTGGAGSRAGDGDSEMKIAQDVQSRLDRFSPTEISADLTALSPEDHEVLAHLIDAAKLMDPIFLRQVWTGNPELEALLEGLPEGSLSEAARAYWRVNFGPWDRLADREPFLGELQAPVGVGYYPEGMSKEDFESWIETHPDDRQAFTSERTVIRSREGVLEAIPYSEEYREWLEPAAVALRKAAEATTNDSLSRFLSLRAEAFGSDEYFASDMAWMDVDAPVEITIGPYETYEDGLFGYKAAFEAYVTVTLPEESEALARYKAELPWLERNLPIPEADKNFDRGTESPIRVVDEVFTGGDAKAGVQTLAFNLPNDEQVREAKGSKKVLLRNVMRAKYDKILVPIAGQVVARDQLDRIDFDAYFNFVLHHELSHGLGPGKITVDGRETEVRLEIKENYSTLEEAKADVMGVYNILALIEKGEMLAGLLETLEPTYLAGLFRSARFGIGEAHGQGVAAQFNFLLEKGALVVDSEGRFRTVSEKFPGAIRALLQEILNLQARGDYDGTVAFLARYGTASDSLMAALGRLEEIPVDIRPIYTDSDG